MILYALAGVAGVALTTGDAAAAPPKHFGAKTTTHVTTHTTPVRKATFQSRVSHKTIVHKQTATHQRFHKTTVTHQGTPTHHTHFGTLHTHTPNKTSTTTTPNKTSTPTTPNKTSTPTKVVLQGKFKNGPKHVGPVVAKKFPIIKIGNNKIVPIWKSGPKKIWVGGHWKVFVPFTALSVVLVGGHYYWPDAYLTVGRPYCEGITPDGCQLNWQLVNFADGGNAWQCVQYCPRPDTPPPAQSASLVPPPPLPPIGACEVTIHSEPNLAGQDATTGDEQPALSQTGWQDAIASIEVKSGVWDFFADENFTGNNMRLRPGTYQNLGPDWTRKINSFMCVMTAVPQ